MENSALEKPVPENFEKIILDLTTDLSSTFPEYSHLWKKWSGNVLEECTPAKKEQEIRALYHYCLSFYPKRFFDILYNNEDIFKEESIQPTAFLPDVDFKLLFNCENVSDNTRKVMWNYLQLILMTVIGSVDSKDMFGSSTEQMFEGIDEKELFEKLNETMESMGNFFQSMTGDKHASKSSDENQNTNQNTNGDTTQNTNGHTDGHTDENKNRDDRKGGDNGDEEEDDADCDPFNPSSFFEKIKGMPDIKDIYGHLKSLFDGKIGSLAKELTEEISKDMENIFGEEGDTQPTSTKEIIEKLMKNPEKMTNLIKTVSKKLDSKISSGEISKDELLKEATELMDKMKTMGDSKDFQEMFKNISKMAGMGGGNKTKFDMNAFQQKTKHSSAREKLKEKMLKRRALQLENAIANSSTHALGDESATPSNNLSSSVPVCSSSSVKYTISDTNKPNNYKFSVDGGVGKDEVTPLHLGSSKSNDMVATEATSSPSPSPKTPSQKSSKKKGKNKH
jgi:hypothetical protein